MSNEPRPRTAPMLNEGISARGAAGRGRRIGFRIVIGLALALIIATWAAVWPPDLTHPLTGWLPDASFDRYGGMFADEAELAEVGGLASHRHHVLAGSLILWTFLIGSAVQLRKPESRQAPLWLLVGLVTVILVVETALVGFDPFTLVFVVLVGAALALHPRRLPEEGVSWTGPGRIVAFAAGIVTGVYAATQIRLQTIGVAGDPHVDAGHYAFVAVAAITLAIASLLGASNLTGARIVAWMGGVMIVLSGAFFIAFPDHASSPGAAWGTLGVILGLVYLAAVARRQPVRTGS